MLGLDVDLYLAEMWNSWFMGSFSILKIGFVLRLRLRHLAKLGFQAHGFMEMNLEALKTLA